MDYKTRSTSRADLRIYAGILRELFGINEKGEFPVLDVLEKLPDVFNGCNYEIVDDSLMPLTTAARCVERSEHAYTIEIKESVYNSVYGNDPLTGASRCHICHEICHLFLFKIGFRPIIERSFGSNELRRCDSVEWQAKALCGEVMIPFEESKGMGLYRIVNYYKVSKSSAEFRINLERSDGY